jgi:hypothetical protein
MPPTWMMLIVSPATVVPQVVLGLAGHDPAAVHHGDGVERGVLGDAEAVGRPLGVVEEADDRDEVAAPLVLQAEGELLGRRAGGLDQRGAHREVLDGIARQHHLGEHDEVDALRHGVLAVLDDQVGVAGEVADRGVDLGEGKTQLGHGHDTIGTSRLGPVGNNAETIGMGD